MIRISEGYLRGAGNDVILAVDRKVNRLFSFIKNSCKSCFLTYGTGQVIHIISRNFWQIDVFTDIIPLIKAPDGTAILFHIKDWNTSEIVIMNDINVENLVQEKPKKKSRGRGM